MKDGREFLLGPDQSNDRDWMERSFFVTLTDLGLEAEFLVGEWKAGGIFHWINL